MSGPVHSRTVHQAALQKLQERGVKLEDIAEIVLQMQTPYHKGLTLIVCLESVEKVLEKRELQHALLVGIELDILAEKKLLHSRFNKSSKRMKVCSDAMKRLP